MAIRIQLDYDGIKRYEKSKPAKAEAKDKAKKIADDAADILRSQVRHEESPTLPIMAESFFVTESGDEVIVSNSDDAFPLIELGTHPGGGETVVKYAPLRKALDRNQRP